MPTELEMWLLFCIFCVFVSNKKKQKTKKKKKKKWNESSILRYNLIISKRCIL